MQNYSKSWIFFQILISEEVNRTAILRTILKKKCLKCNIFLRTERTNVYDSTKEKNHPTVSFESNFSISFVEIYKQVWIDATSVTQKYDHHRTFDRKVLNTISIGTILFFESFVLRDAFKNGCPWSKLDKKRFNTWPITYAVRFPVSNFSSW